MENKKFEIVGLYPIYGTYNKFLVFSGHLYLLDLEMDVRGFKIRLSLGSEESMVFDPLISEFDHEEGREVDFPVVSSINQEWWDEIKHEFLKFAEKEIKRFRWPKKFPKNYKEYKKTIWKHRKNESVKQSK